MKVSAVIPTRGNVDLASILATLGWCDEVIVYDNAHRDDLGIYGRYAATGEARNDVIYTQDDDVLVTCHEELLAEYEPGRVLVNYPEPWDIPWVARGALFHRDLPAQAFARYRRQFPADEFFTHYACDGVFTLLSDCKVVDLGSEDLPHGFAPGRVSTSPGWYRSLRPEITRRCTQLAAMAT